MAPVLFAWTPFNNPLNDPVATSPTLAKWSWVSVNTELLLRRVGNWRLTRGEWTTVHRFYHSWSAKLSATNKEHARTEVGGPHLTEREDDSVDRGSQKVGLKVGLKGICPTNGTLMVTYNCVWHSCLRKEQWWCKRQEHVMSALLTSQLQRLTSISKQPQIWQCGKQTVTQLGFGRRLDPSRKLGFGSNLELMLNVGGGGVHAALLGCKIAFVRQSAWMPMLQSLKPMPLLHAMQC